jgi:hypothetical protein
MLTRSNVYINDTIPLIDDLHPNLSLQAMPVDNTKVISPRRTTKKLTEEEIKDIEQKRLRGEYDYDHLIDLCKS